MGHETWPESLLAADLAIAWSHAVHCPVPRSFGFADRVVAEHVLWYLTDGGITVREGGRSHRLGPHDLVWFRPGTPHGADQHAHRGFTCYSLRFSLGDHAAPPGTTILTGRGDLLDTVDGILRDHQLGDRHALRRIGAALYLLATAERPTGGDDRGFNHHQRQELLRFARRNAHRRPSPADLAAEVDLSPDYFARVFKRAYGRSPKRWLMEQRIHRAAFRLTHETTPIGTIADELGYGDEAVFRRQFRDVMGCSPSAHRRRG